MNKKNVLRWTLGIAQTLGAFSAIFAMSYFIFISYLSGQLSLSLVTMITFSLLVIVYMSILVTSLYGGVLLLKGSPKFYKPTLISFFCQIPIFNFFELLEYDLGLGLFVKLMVTFTSLPSGIHAQFNSFYYAGISTYASTSDTFEGVLTLGVNIIPILWLILLKKFYRKKSEKNSFTETI